MKQPKGYDALVDISSTSTKKRKGGGVSFGAGTDQPPKALNLDFSQRKRMAGTMVAKKAELKVSESAPPAGGKPRKEKRGKMFCLLGPFIIAAILPFIVII